MFCGCGGARLLIVAEKLRFGLTNRLWHGACHWDGMQQTNGIIDSSLEASSAGRQQLVGLEILLHVTDPELCDELGAYPEGRARHDFAIGALKIGALALRHARTRMDVQNIRTEGDRLLEELRQALDGHQRGAQELAGRLFRSRRRSARIARRNGKQRSRILRRSSVRYARSRNKHRTSTKSQVGQEPSVPTATTS